MHVLHVLRDVVGQIAVGTLRGNLHREDGEVLDLHLVALQTELTDTRHHVLQDAEDDTCRVRRIVVVHVFGQLSQVVRFFFLHAAIDHAIALRRGHLVSVKIQFKHSSCCFKGFSFCVGVSHRENKISRLEKIFSRAENSFSPCKVTTFRRGGDDFRELRIDTELFYEIFHDTWRKHLLMGLQSHGR